MFFGLRWEGSVEVGFLIQRVTPQPLKFGVDFESHVKKIPEHKPRLARRGTLLPSMCPPADQCFAGSQTLISASG
jgi:hypothetical protein